MFATFPTFSTTSFKPLPTAFSSYARAEGEGQVAIPGPTHLKWRETMEATAVEDKGVRKPMPEAVLGSH